MTATLSFAESLPDTSFSVSSISSPPALNFQPRTPAQQSTQMTAAAPRLRITETANRQPKSGDPVFSDRRGGRLAGGNGARGPGLSGAEFPGPVGAGGAGWSPGVGTFGSGFMR